MASTRIVCDNGSGAIKIGFGSSASPKILPNAIFKAKHVRTRSFISSQLEECKDLSGIFYVLPFQKGYCVNLELERQIWEYAFTLLYHERTKDKNAMPDFNDYSLVLSEPVFNFSVIGEATDEILFEEFGFAELSRVPAPFLSAQAYKHDVKVGKVQASQSIETSNTTASKAISGCLVVDSGQSFTHIVPVVDDRIVSAAVRRIDIGGKQLTNHLKDLISYRYLNVLDETHVINQCKEDCCYVATDFESELQRAHDSQSFRSDQTAEEKTPQNTMCEYVLPDFSAIQRGYVREPRSRKACSASEQQFIRLNNERFSVPELLFRPGDVGLAQAGVSECLGEHVLNSSFAKRPALRELLARNVLLTGGNCLFAGLRDRVSADVRASQPCHIPVNVYQPPNAQTYAWQGGKLLASAAEYSELYKSVTVKKSEYEEIGSTVCRERFASVYLD